MTVAGKGEVFEELVREYFSRRGFLAVRSVIYQFENDDVTDIDIWLYGKQASGIRLHAIVDAKNKKSPKAFERILWVKGLQAITGSDRCFVATTDKSDKIVKFGQLNDVLIVNKAFLESVTQPGNGGRLTLEEFIDYIQQFDSWKQDGDWLRVLGQVKSAVASAPAFQAANIALSGFSFFGGRIASRPKYSDQALRCAMFCASMSFLALDRALEPFQFSNPLVRKAAILNGLSFGDSGDGKTIKNISSVISVIAEHIDNGRVIATNVRNFFDRLPEVSRSTIIADYFSTEAKSQRLFQIAREFERFVFAKQESDTDFSIESKSALGILADYTQVDRKSLLPILISKSSPDPKESSLGTVSVHLDDGKLL